MTYNGMTQIQPADSEEYPMASVTFPASAKIIDKGNGSSLTIKREFIPKEVKPTMIQIEATTLDELTTKFLNVFNINMADYADSASYANAINAVVNKWVASKNTDPYILIYYNYNYYTLDIDDNQNDWLYKSGMNDVSDISFTSLEVNSWWEGANDIHDFKVRKLWMQWVLGADSLLETPKFWKEMEFSIDNPKLSLNITNPEDKDYIEGKLVETDENGMDFIIPDSEILWDYNHNGYGDMMEDDCYHIRKTIEFYEGEDYIVTNLTKNTTQTVTVTEGNIDFVTSYGLPITLVVNNQNISSDVILAIFNNHSENGWSNGDEETFNIKPVNPHIKKLDPKFLPEGYGASDWEQNDETAADYIKNRTHYIKENTAQTVIENVSMTASYMEDNLHPYNGQSKGVHFEPASSQSIPELENLQPGRTYSVVLDEKHVCTGILKDITEEMAETMPIVEVNCAYYLGNGAILNFGNSEGYETSIPGITNFDTGENFGILVITATMGTDTRTNFAGTYLGLDYETLLENGTNDKTLSVAIKEVDNSYSKLDMNYLPNSLVREWLPYKKYYKDTPVHKDGSIYKALETFVEGSEISTVKGSIGEIIPTEGMQIRGEGVIRPDWSFFENISDADLFNYIIADGFTISASEAMEDDIETGVDLTSTPYRFHKIFDSSMGRFTHLISSDEDRFQDVIMCIPNEYITESGKISIRMFTSPISETFTWYMMIMEDIVLDENGQFVSGTRYPKEFISEAMGISFKTNDFVVDTITSVSDHFSDTFKILKDVQNPKWELLHTHFIDGQFNDDETIKYYDNILNKEDSGYETAKANVKPGSIIFNTKGGYKNVHFSIYLGGGNS